MRSVTLFPQFVKHATSTVPAPLSRTIRHMSSLTKKGGSPVPFLVSKRHIVSVATAPSQVSASAYRAPELPKAEFAKLIRKPPEFFGQLVEGVKHELQQTGEIPVRQGLHKLLSADQRKKYLQTIITNMAFSAPVAANFTKSALGLPPMGSAIYAHMFAGVVDDIASKSDLPLKDAVRIATYYRSPILVEEHARLGFSPEQSHEAISKSFFLQYWSADTQDPLIFNPMVRSFYPGDSHITTGSNDLGREVEFQAARLFAMGHEGLPAPVTLINTGDSGPFTDGFMHAMQHVIEATEMGFKMPVIFMVNANNSSISSRLDHESAERSVAKIEQRFKSWGNVIDPGFVTQAEDVVGGISSMRSAVDQVLETGRPTYCISFFPFRPLGHASDASPAGDDLLQYQFHAFKDLLVKQILGCCESGTTGNQVAEMMGQMSQSIESAISHALTGRQILTRPEIEELSVPGITLMKSEPGKLVDVPLAYLLGKGHKSYTGMGADIYGKAIDGLMTRMEKAGREVRYVHQENHRPNKTDTRGGVYGELGKVSERHLDRNFLSFLPHEAQITQVGAALRTVLPEGNIVFVKGPHTLFNEHAKDHLKYAAFRESDTGQKANVIYLMDGGSLAAREVETVDTENGPVERDLILAKVGEHHNSNGYSGYAEDPNTILALPMDANCFSAMLPQLADLHDMGRMVIGFVPTASFGQLHGTIDLPELGQNDTMRIAIPGAKPQNGKSLAVVTWGPDAKMVAKTLADQGIEATLFVLSYAKAPNSFVSWLDAQAQSGTQTEVITVDPNPDAALLSPVMTTVKRALDYPESLHFSDCTVDPSFVPYGIGEGLLAPKDLIRTLGLRGLTSDKLTSTRVIPPLSLSTQPPPDLGEELSEHIVMAPMEAERATVTFHVQPGDAVAEDQVIAEIEADKGTVEILAPVAGVLKEFRVPELEELEILTTTELFQILPQSNAQSETVPPFKTKETRQTRPNPITLESGASVTPLSRMQLAMADNMTVKPGDTKSFGVSETVDFQPLMALSKQSKLSPVTYLIKQLGESAQALGLNKKLTTEKTGMSSGFSSVDIGLAMEVDGQLRVAVVRDVLNKSEAEIKADIVAMVKQGPKLSPQDQNLDNVCYILTSLGKDAPKIVNPTLPKGMTGILGIGGMRKDQSEFSFSLCHATLNGSEGAKLMTDVSARISSMGEAETPAPSKYKPMIRFRYAQQKKNPGQ